MRNHIRILTVFIFALMVVSILQVANLATGSVAGSANSIAVAQSTASASSRTYFDHVVIILMENEGINHICNRNPPPCSGTNSPYMSSLANSYSISQQYLPTLSTNENT